MYLLSKIIWAVFKPFHLFLYSLAIGAALSAWTGGRFRRFGQWLVGIALLTMVGLNLLPLGSWAVSSLESRFPPPRAAFGHVDGIIVLGGMFDTAKSKDRGTLALNGSADRLWAGLELARRHPNAKIVFTGGNALPLADAPSEADLAKRALQAAGLDGARLIFEGKSRNTHENAVYTRSLVPQDRGQIWLLVTSASHMPRAMGCFRAAGWQVTPYPVDYVIGETIDAIVDFSMMKQFSYLNHAAHEWLGLAYYALRGWTHTVFPAPD